MTSTPTPTQPQGWYRFYDMHSGGSRKTIWDIVYVQAPTEDAARGRFTEETSEDPDEIACQCCGSNFSVSGPYVGLAEALGDDVDGSHLVLGAGQ